MHMKKALPFIAIAAAAFNLYAGKTITVPNEFKTIEAALEQAEEGDTVFVHRGIYREKIMLKDKVALIGESVRETIIRGKGRGVLVKGANKAVIRNFTIENGEKGILCENVTMTIEHNCIVGNEASGIHCLVSLPAIRNNVVYRNKGTGIFCETVRSLRTVVEHNIIAENGYCGILLSGNSEVVVQNNVFMRNKQFGIWVNDGARRSRIVYNDFYMNRNNYNNYAQVDRTNLGIDPEYPEATRGMAGISPAQLFTAPVTALKEKGKDGKDIGLVSEKEMVERDLDVDGDGIPDVNDKCASIAEDRDGFMDDDGCPDFDNDNDGIYDAQDQCPNEPEDKDGFKDEDGCPDLDNDRDGVADTADVCPGEPETVNGFKDEDGCPDMVPPDWKPGSAAPAVDPASQVSAPAPVPADTAVKPVPVDTVKTVAPAPAAKVKVKQKPAVKAVPADTAAKVKVKQKPVSKAAPVDTAKKTAGK
jgi:OmpA-OmpF porin, OOP family